MKSYEWEDKGLGACIACVLLVILAAALLVALVVSAAELYESYLPLVGNNYNNCYNPDEPWQCQVQTAWAATQTARVPATPTLAPTMPPYPTNQPTYPPPNTPGVTK